MNVLNVNYDTHQTGANLQETSLSPQTNWNTFGRIGTYPVDGQVYAQPLYVNGVAIGGATYNVVFVATMHNSVFAFDADAPQSGTPLWQVNLVYFQPGKARLLKSAKDVADAQAAGDLLPGFPAAIPVIVECSVIYTPAGGLLPTATIQEARRDGDDGDHR